MCRRTLKLKSDVFLPTLANAYELNKFFFFFFVNISFSFNSVS
jgi:hypothetical protein